MTFKDTERGKAYYRKWREDNRERTKAKQRAYAETPEGRAVIAAHYAKYYSDRTVRIRALVHGAIARATKAGLRCDEGLAEHLLLQPLKHCECCSRELDYSAGRGRGNRDASPSP